MIKVILHRILVKQNKLEETNKEYLKAKQIGLIIPDHEDKLRAQAGVDTGIITAIGPTAFRDFGVESPIKVGDQVAFARYSGKIITDPEDGQEYVLLNDEDVCVILSGDKK